MKPIRIISPGFELLAEIDNYESMSLIRRWHGIGEIEIRINRYKQHTDQMVKGNLILVGSQLNKAFIIRHREIELNENGKASENWLIKGLALKSITGQRITIPPDTLAYDSISADAETVMKHYVDSNLVNPADVNRKIAQVEIVAILNRGPNIAWQSRFKNLAEELANLSLISGLGWDFSLDIQEQRFVFDVRGWRDLTVNQTDNPPVIFSPQFDSLQSLHYTESDLNYRNVGIVGGQGEGAAREIVEVGSAAGLARHEVFIDARDIAEGSGDLQTRGQQKLQEFLTEQYLEGQILTNSPFVYEKDYDLGDIVTVQNKEWQVTMDTRLTEVKEFYEVTGFKIEATFGNNRPTIIQKIKQELSQISGEVRK